MTNHFVRPRWRPTTSLGRLATAFGTLFLLSFLMLQTMVASGQRGGDTFSDNWWLAGPGFVAAGSALCGLVIAVVAMRRVHERSIAVVATVVLGALAVAFVILEVLAPH